MEIGFEDYPDFDACKAGSAASVQCPPYASATCFNVEAISVDLRLVNPVKGYFCLRIASQKHGTIFTWIVLLDRKIQGITRIKIPSKKVTEEVVRTSTHLQLIAMSMLMA